MFVQAAQFLTVLMLVASVAPAYDVRDGAISDLGVIPETAVLFNASLILAGTLNVVVGLLRFRGSDRWSFIAFGMAGIGAIGAGLVPLDRGDAHSLFALVAFVFFNLQAILASRGVGRPMVAIGVGAGIVGLTFVVLMIIGDAGNAAAFGPIGHGGTERMIVYPVMLWLLAFGGSLMADRAELPAASTRAIGVTSGPGDPDQRP
jgi:hypothetical membrane protein